MINRYEQLLPEVTYHVYNRANGSEKLFISNENYRFFLEKYRYHIEPIADTFCYCLMPNHFHFLVRIKSEQEVYKVLTPFPKFVTLEKVLSKQFSNFFSCYTQAFNKQQNRKGSLFMKNFNRIRVNDSKHFNSLVPYIHLNAVEAGLCSKPEDWQHSSYQSILQQNDSFIRASELISIFDDLDNFKFLHSTNSRPLP